ncbi:hypothetical protein NM208_g14052 [Fusarium decemcellulare]|uniref:Uncharacterized protein n=1 Tax=Fusarium decemcellulare TaxID=57161 RepID=A0ACC1RIQ4_9HYPO|nr:hypothetical protein NM208_g14052 [Fusarium decemcellulare]
MQGKKLFSMPGGGLIALLQDQLSAVVTRHLQMQKHAEILWNHTVLGLGQDADHAWVDVDTPQGKQRLEAQYIVGCDGASSTVRRELLGREAMPGFTWDKQLVAADVRHDLLDAFPDAEDSNVFLDSENAWLMFRPSKQDDLHWRIIYRDVDGLDETEYISRAPGKLQGLLPGRPSLAQIDIMRVRSYKIHQRLVETMRKGRFLLAGDAAHLCCPATVNLRGALGLNGAVADVGSLFDCLMAIHEGKATDDILDVYSDVRREKFNTIINPQSQSTMRTIFSDPKDIVPNHPMYKFSQLLQTNPELAKKNAPDPLALRYDFSIHFSHAQSMQQTGVADSSEGFDDIPTKEAL